MKPVLHLLLAAALLAPVVAAADDDGAKKADDRERRERVQLWLDIKKRQEAATVDRLRGGDAATKRSIARQRSKPKRDIRKRNNVELLRLEAELKRLAELEQAKSKKEKS